MRRMCLQPKRAAPVRWSIKDMLDYPVDAAMVDAVHVPASDTGGRPAQMLAVAARNDLIAATVKPFNDANIDLSVIDIPELAQRNIAKCLEEQGRGLALLCFDQAAATLTFTSGGELYQSRRIDVALTDFETEAARRNPLRPDHAGTAAFAGSF